jgi:hypothetical protein
MERSGLHSNRSANLEKLSDSPNSRRWGVSIAGQRGWRFNRTQSKLIKPFAIHYWQGGAAAPPLISAFLWTNA